MKNQLIRHTVPNIRQARPNKAIKVVYSKELTFSRSRLLITRNFSNNSNNYCYVKRLLEDIELAYSDLYYLFGTMDPNKVADIKERILARTYKMSPLRLKLYYRSEEIGEIYEISFLLKQKKPISIAAFCHTVVCTQADRLVQTGLARTLNHLFQKKMIIFGNTYGYTMLIREYYGKIVCTRNHVSLLYQIDLKSSCHTLNRERLLIKLRDIVPDQRILDLLEDFLYSKMLDSTGKPSEICDVLETNIPPFGLLTDVLLNLAFLDFDQRLALLYPQAEFEYSRYATEVLVSANGMYLSSERFQRFVLNLLDELHFSGEIISIGPGDEPVPGLGGCLLSVSQEGSIIVQGQ